MKNNTSYVPEVPVATGDYPIVHRTLELLSPEKREEILIKAVSRMLASARRFPRDAKPHEETLLEQVAHKAQSLLEAEQAQRLAQEVYESTGIDARRKTFRRQYTPLTLRQFA